MYKVLYRKWRPQTFKEVVGQPQVTLTLEGEVLAGRLAHAYLFTGSRGTGKTSCAKILSKAVNCLDIKEGNPCNECENCKGIDNGSILDVLEIDAASNRGIDDIKALREDSAFTPAQAKYRVYIIDEVHMLTIEAFNALLKTLEEPPAHVIFILATTEVQKLPSTILSRCQRFDFRRIEPNIIAEHLRHVANEESSSIEFDAAVLIARIADGALRDALSLLDRCISANAKGIDTALVREIAGVIGNDFLFEISKAIHDKDINTALLLADELHKASMDSERFCFEFINHFRNLMLAKTLKSPEDMIISTKDEIENLKNHSKLFSLDEIMRAIDILTETAESLRQSKSGRIEVESALIRLCSPKLEEDIPALIVRLEELEKSLNNIKQQASRNVHQNLHKEKFNDKINTNVSKDNMPNADIGRPDEMPISNKEDLPFSLDENIEKEETQTQKTENYVDKGLPFSLDENIEEEKLQTQKAENYVDKGLPFLPGESFEEEKIQTQKAEKYVDKGLPFLPGESFEEEKIQTQKAENYKNVSLPFDEDDNFIPPFVSDDINIQKDLADEDDNGFASMPFDEDNYQPPSNNAENPIFDDADEYLPFGEQAEDENSLAYSGGEAEISEGVLPAQVWDGFCSELSNQIPLMCSMLKGAKGEIRGNVLVLKTPNPVVENFLKHNEACVKGIVDTAKKVLNLDLSVRAELVN